MLPSAVVLVNEIIFSRSNSIFNSDRLKKDRRVVHRVTTNDNEWLRVVQRATTSGTTSDNEWQRVATSGKRMTTRENEWPFWLFSFK